MIWDVVSISFAIIFDSRISIDLVQLVKEHVLEHRSSSYKLILLLDFSFSKLSFDSLESVNLSDANESE